MGECLPVGAETAAYAAPDRKKQNYVFPSFPRTSLIQLLKKKSMPVSYHGQTTALALANVANLDLTLTECTQHASLQLDISPGNHDTPVTRQGTRYTNLIVSVVTGDLPLSSPMTATLSVIAVCDVKSTDEASHLISVSETRSFISELKRLQSFASASEAHISEWDDESSIEAERFFFADTGGEFNCIDARDTAKHSWLTTAADDAVEPLAFTEFFAGIEGFASSEEPAASVDTCNWPSIETSADCNVDGNTSEHGTSLAFADDVITAAAIVQSIEEFDDTERLFCSPTDAVLTANDTCSWLLIWSSTELIWRSAPTTGEAVRQCCSSATAGDVTWAIAFEAVFDVVNSTERLLLLETEDFVTVDDNCDWRTVWLSTGQRSSSAVADGVIKVFEFDGLFNGTERLRFAGTEVLAVTDDSSDRPLVWSSAALSWVFAEISRVAGTRCASFGSADGVIRAFAFEEFIDEAERFLLILAAGNTTRDGQLLCSSEGTSVDGNSARQSSSFASTDDSIRSLALEVVFDEIDEVEHLRFAGTTALAAHDDDTCNSQLFWTSTELLRRRLEPTVAFEVFFNETERLLVVTADKLAVDDDSSSWQQVWSPAATSADGIAEQDRSLSTSVGDVIASFTFKVVFNKVDETERFLLIEAENRAEGVADDDDCNWQGVWPSAEASVDGKIIEHCSSFASADDISAFEFETFFNVTERFILPGTEELVTGDGIPNWQVVWSPPAETSVGIQSSDLAQGERPFADRPPRSSASHTESAQPEALASTSAAATL
jgi:hypothetical protein